VKHVMPRGGKNPVWRRVDPVVTSAREKKGLPGRAPKISVVVPVYHTPLNYLEEMLRSVLAQTYEDWELCLADGSADGVLRPTLNAYAAIDKRIKVLFLPENKGVAGNTNEALCLASGEYVVFLDHDDTLATWALARVAEAFARYPDARFVYSDYAVTDEAGNVIHHLYCPDFAKYFYLSFPYIVHLVAVRKEILEKVGFLDEKVFTEGVSHDVDLFLRIFAIITQDQVIHIPEILYYWRNYALSTGHRFIDKVHHYTRLAINRYLSLTGTEGWVEDGPQFNSFRLRLRRKYDPLVSVIIQRQSEQKVFERCISRLLAANYSRIEVIIMAAGTQLPETFTAGEPVSVVKYDEPLGYGAVNNWGARHAKGDLLLFLADDVWFGTDESLPSLIELTGLPDTGAVGAKLLYPDNRVQHAGIILGLFGAAGHWHKHVDACPGEGLANRGYLSSLISIREYSAVSGSCLAVRRSLFDEVGGFDEEFRYRYGDVDLCLRILDRGLKVLFTPYALAYHDDHHPPVPGFEQDPPEDGDRSHFLGKWGHRIAGGDPYYNPHLGLDSYLPLPAERAGIAPVRSWHRQVIRHSRR